MKGVTIRLLAVWLAAASVVSAQDRNAVIMPRTRQAPVPDGRLADPCWAQALSIDGFTQPMSETAPVQRVQARLCFDDEALYVALICFERAPQTIRSSQREKDVYLDDCVELWIRSTGDAAEYDQFLVNAISTVELARQRAQGGAEHIRPAAKAGSRIERDRWVCELAIPFGDLGRAEPLLPGEFLEMKIGREDYAGLDTPGQPTLAIWPPRVRYGGSEGYAPVYAERINLLDDPDLSAPGAPGVKWACGPADASCFEGVREGGERLVRARACDRSCALRQRARLAPGHLYRLTAEVQGSAAGFLRVSRPAAQADQGDTVCEALFPAGREWRRRDCLFTAGSEPGEWVVTVGLDGSPTGGTALIRNLALFAEVAQDRLGPAVPVPIGLREPYVIRHVPVTDCRAVRGFIGTPIDGTLESRDYMGKYWEYDAPGADYGVSYVYRGNDGLHIELADGEGVNAIQVRGGVAADVYGDGTDFDNPLSGRKVHRFPGKARMSLFWSDEPIRARRFSFFDVRDGHISDVIFLRTGGAAAALGEALAAPIGGKGSAKHLGEFFEQRFEAGEREIYAVLPATNRLAGSLALHADAAVHVVAGPFSTELPLAAVGLRGDREGSAEPVTLTVQVQDPIHPRTALTTVALEVPGSGLLNVALDIPDQVLPPGKAVWLSITAHADVRLKEPVLTLYRVPRAQAVPGALAYHLTKLKGFYVPLSESRPWNVMGRGQSNEEWLMAAPGIGPIRIQLMELIHAIEHVHALRADDPIVKQYRDWFYRKRTRLELPAARLPEDPDAPEWAVVGRAAWLAARTVPEWWLTHRLAPSGEFGRFDDDTDMYQNYANFPMLETNGIVPVLKDGAARMLAIAERDHLEAGINRRSMDPLHAYEEGINQESLLMWWNYGHPLYVERCMAAARSVEALTTVNRAGHRHFKSQILGSDDLRLDRPTDQDGQTHAQMMHPVCEVAYYNRNPRALRLLQGYGEAWLAHQQAGSYALLVDVGSDTVATTADEPYMGGFGCQASIMCFLARVTGDGKYLRPLVDFFGSAASSELAGNYAADLYQLGLLDGRAEACRKRFAESPALEWMVTGNKRPLLEYLKRESLSEIQTFGHIYTTAEPYTDRVFLYAIDGPAVAFTGGFANRNKPYHSHAVSWEGFSTNYAALVREGRKDRFHALLFNFADRPLKGAMRFWMLDHGLYTLTTGVDENGDDSADRPDARRDVEIIRGDPVELVLPARKVTVVTLLRKRTLDVLESRADLAVVGEELQVTNQMVQGVAHNIGSQNVLGASVALMDADGKIRQKRLLGAIPAPADLTPQRTAFWLEGVPENHGGWRVVLDPDDAVPEITERNNTALVP